MFLKNSLNIIYGSISLLPLAIITGPFISDLIVTLIAIFFITTNYLNFLEYVKKNSLIKLLLFFCFINIINSLFAEELINSLKSSFFYLRFPFFIVAICLFLRNNEHHCLYIYYGLLFSIFLVSADAIIQFFLGENIVGYISQSRNRISGFFNEEYILGSYLSRLTPILISLYFFLNQRNKLNLPLFLITCLISFVAILFSGERTSIFFIILFYTIFLFFIFNFSLQKKILIVLTFFVVTFVTIFSSDSLKARYIDLTLKQIDSFFIPTSGQKDENALNSQRIKHIKVSYEMFKENKVFGYGNKMFAHTCFNYFFADDGRCSTHPHNYAAQLLVENGLVGFLAFLLILFYLFKDIFKNRKSRFIFPVLLIILITLFPLFPSGNFYNNKISIFLYFPLSIYLFYKNQLNKKYPIK